MPRSSGVYIPPAGTKGVPNTTIQSAPYNAFVDDLTADANAPRPVTAGGTGASNATAARTNLDVYSKAENDAALTGKLDKTGGAMSGPLEIGPASFVVIKDTNDARFSWSVDVSDIEIGFFWNAEEGLGTQGYKFNVGRDGAVWTAQLGDLAGHISSSIAAGVAGKANRAGDTFTGAIQAPQVNFGATSFHARLSGGTTPVIDFDANDYYSYDRANNFHQIVIGGAEKMRIGPAGVDLLGGGLFGASISASLLTSGTVADARLPAQQSRKRLDMAGSGIGVAQAFEVAALEVYAGAGWEAFIGFHRGGIAAQTLGLGSDNNMRIGFNNGTSARIWHEQNFNPDTKANTGTLGRSGLIETGALNVGSSAVNATADLPDPYICAGLRIAIIATQPHIVVRGVLGVK